MAADLQGLGRRVEAVQDGVAEVDATNDVHAVHHGQPVRQLASQLCAVHPHADGQVLGRGVQFVQIVLPFIEVVAHFLVRHGDRAGPGAGAAAVGVPVLGRGGQLRGGQPVAAVQVHHRAGQRRM